MMFHARRVSVSGLLVRDVHGGGECCVVCVFFFYICRCIEVERLFSESYASKFQAQDVGTLAAQKFSVCVCVCGCVS